MERRNSRGKWRYRGFRGWAMAFVSPDDHVSSVEDGRHQATERRPAWRCTTPGGRGGAPTCSRRCSTPSPRHNKTIPRSSDAWEASRRYALGAAKTLASFGFRCGMTTAFGADPLKKALAATKSGGLQGVLRGRHGRLGVVSRRGRGLQVRLRAPRRVGARGQPAPPPSCCSTISIAACRRRSWR